jgi:hypothetical protein
VLDFLPCHGLAVVVLLLLLLLLLAGFGCRCE